MPPGIAFDAAAIKIKVTSLTVGTKCTNGYRKFRLSFGTSGWVKGNSAYLLVNDGNETVAGKKYHFASFQTLSQLFRPAPFVKCGRFFFWSLILKDYIQVEKIKGEFVVVCSRLPRALAWDQAPQFGGKGSLRK